MHHKMSKKIAQLTKVIYHLNTKNEDHQAEIDDLANNNQLEIQHILRDAAAKIGKFKEMVESKQVTANVEAQIEKLQRKHEAEKQTAMKQLEDFKMKMKAREQSLAADFQNKFETTQEKVEKMNAKFRERIDAFDKLSQQYQTDIANARASGSAGEEATRLKYEKEMEEYVITSNAKYQAMMVEQLSLQDKLKAEMEAKMSKLRTELEAKFKEDLQKQLGMLRAQLNGEKQEALLQLKREFEERIQKLKDDASTNLENALGELKRRGDEMSVLRQEKDKVIQELQESIEQLNAAITSLSQDSSSKTQELLDSLRQAQEEVAGLRAAADTRAVEIAALQVDVEKKQDENDELSLQMSQVEQEVARLNGLLAAATSSKDAAAADAGTKLNSLQAELAALKTKNTEQEKTIKDLKDELVKLKAASKAAAEKAEKEIDALKAENKKLAQQLKDVSASGSKATDQAKEELARLRKQLEDREKSFAAEKKEQDETHRKATTSLNDKHTSEMLAAAAAAKEAAEQLKRKEQTWRESIDELRREYTHEKAAVEAVQAGKIAELTQAHEEVVSKMKVTIKGLEQQISELIAQADKDKGGLSAEMSKLDTKVKNLQKDIEKRKKESEKIESVCSSLKNQVESLREELKQVQVAHVEKLAQVKLKLDAEWTKKLDALAEENSRSLSAGMEDCVRQHKEQLAALTRDYEDQLLALKQALQKEASDANSSSLAAEQERERLEKELKSEKAAHAKTESDWAARHAEELSALEAKLRKEADAQRKALTETSESKIAEISDAFASEKAALVDSMNKAKDDMRRDLMEETQGKITALEEAGAKREKELGERLAKDKAAAMEELKAKRKAAVAALKDEHAREKAQWEADRGVIQEQLASSQKHGIELAGLREKDQVEFKQKQSLWEGEKENLRGQFESQIRKEKEAAEVRIMDATERMNQEVKILKQEFKEDTERFEERMTEAGVEFKKLLTKYNNRESRPEDVQRIKQLEAEMVEKDALVAKTREEMNYFKREMLNREEGYNQKFNATPQVGVMDPLAGKSKKKGSTKGGFGGTNNAPQNVVGAGNMTGGMGIGGGGMGSRGTSK